jgi:hypothetical protein
VAAESGQNGDAIDGFQLGFGFVEINSNAASTAR